MGAEFFEGIWESEGLKKVPYYGNNFTNWIDCVYSLGKILIEFKCGEKGRFEIKIKAPAVFSGGGPGYLEIKSDEIKILNRKMRLKTTGEIINFEILSSNRLKMKLFEEYFIFKKRDQLNR